MWADVRGLGFRADIHVLGVSSLVSRAGGRNVALGPVSIENLRKRRESLP